MQIGVLSFAHYHANFWSEVLAARGALAGVWDSDVTRGREAAARFGTDFFDNMHTIRVRVRVNITGTKKLYYYCNSGLEVLRQS